MISMVNLKESSLVELKLDDIEKVFASTDVEKSKEEVKSKQEVNNATNLSSVSVEKSKDPCNINIEELNLVPEVPKRSEELKHNGEPQAMRNQKDAVLDERAAALEEKHLALQLNHDLLREEAALKRSLKITEKERDIARKELQA